MTKLHFIGIFIGIALSTLLSNAWAQQDTVVVDSTATFLIEEPEIFIDLYYPEMHGGYIDMTPGQYVDSLPFNMDHIKGGWRRIVSAGYHTPNGDAMYEPYEVHGSIYFSDDKVYYMSYPIRMHSYATYHLDAAHNMTLADQKVLPDSLDWFSETPGLFTKDSLTYLYFDGEYYRREDMEHEIVLELEQKTIRPEVLVGDWIKTDTLSCCYGTTWWQEYPWDMPEEIHISKTWANKIYKKQKIYIEIDGEFRSFFIQVLGEYEMEIEAGSWFKGKADRVVYRKRWY